MPDAPSRQLADRNVPASVLAAATLPIYGITWGRPVISAVGAACFDAILVFIRNSPRPKAEYERQADVWKPDFPARSLYLRVWGGGGWGIQAESFRLDRRFPWEAASAAPFFVWNGISDPSALSQLPQSNWKLCDLLLLRHVWPGRGPVFRASRIRENPRNPTLFNHTRGLPRTRRLQLFGPFVPKRRFQLTPHLLRDAT